MTTTTTIPATATTTTLVDREKMAIFLGMNPQATNSEIRQYFRDCGKMIDSGMSSPSWGFGWETMLVPSGAKMEFDNSIGPARYRYWIPALN